MATINGTSANDTLNGTTAADVIDGKAGADRMTGGRGNDYYYVDNVGDVIVEKDAEGFDTVQSSVSYSLPYAVENLILSGTGNLNGTGNGWNNTITGNAGNNRLDGGNGLDTINGGAGDDVLIGGLANDTLDGGTGTDTAVYTRKFADYKITRNADGSVTVQALVGSEGTDLLKNIETLQFADRVYQLSGTTPTPDPDPEPEPKPEPEPEPSNGPKPTLTGTSANNTLVGTAGADVIDGKEGADRMNGTGGDDYYYVDNAGDVVVEQANAGNDTVQASVSHTLAYAVENLILSGTENLNGTGNGYDNVMTGNSGDNQLDGRAGNDTLNGGAGNDTLIGGHGNDTIDGGAGTDTAVFSRKFADYKITQNADGSTTVQALVGLDGVDVVKNVETLKFADKTYQLTETATPTPDPDPTPTPTPDPDPTPTPTPTPTPKPNGPVVQLKTGATQADIQSAINNAADGTTIILPKNAYIKIAGSLKIDATHKDITLDLNGSILKQAAGDQVIEAYASHAWTKSVSLASSNGNTVVKFSSTPSDLKVGDWIKVVADDNLPGSTWASIRMGQAMKVAKIDGNSVTLEGSLNDASHYKTNVRAAKYESGEVEIRNGIIEGDQSQSSWKTSLVLLDSLIGAQVDNLTVRDNNSMGIQIVDNIHTRVTDTVVKNLKDNTTNANYGYGVLSSGSLGTVVDGLYAETVRHAIDSSQTGVAANYADAGRYGADIGMVVKNSVVYNATSSAFSWHSESNYATLDNVQAFDSQNFATVRGLHGTVKDSVGVNTKNGLQIFEYGTGDGRFIEIDNVTLREVGGWGVFESNNPTKNVIRDSHIEAYGTPNALSSDAATIVNTVFKKITSDVDTMVGTNGADKLFGGKAADKISGGDGNDVIWGGAGADTLTGGAGVDRFTYHSTSEAGDVITDFKAGAGGDVLDLGLIFTKAGYRGTSAFADGAVRVVQSGADTLVQVDANGGGNAFTTLTTLKGVAASSLTLDNFDNFFGSDATTDVKVLGAATDAYGA